MRGHPQSSISGDISQQAIPPGIDFRRCTRWGTWPGDTARSRSLYSGNTISERLCDLLQPRKVPAETSCHPGVDLPEERNERDPCGTPGTDMLRCRGGEGFNKVHLLHPGSDRRSSRPENPLHAWEGIREDRTFIRPPVRLSQSSMPHYPSIALISHAVSGVAVSLGRIRQIASSISLSVCS